MIGKLEKGSSFRGCLKYVLEKEGALYLGGNMLGESVAELTAEFSAAHRLNPDLNVSVFHAMLSVAAHEWRTDEQWLEMAEEYLKRMGFGTCQYVVVRHTDEPHDHIHIVASRHQIPDGKTVSDSQDYSRSEEIIRDLERLYNLEPVVPSYERLERSPSTGEVRKFEKQQAQFEQELREVPADPPLRMVLQRLITDLCRNKPTMPELIQQLQERGVEVAVEQTKKQEWGISFALGEEHYSGTQLGRAFTFQGLKKHLGVNYECERDDAKIRAVLGRHDRTQAQPAAAIATNQRTDAGDAGIAPGEQQLEAAASRLARSTSDLTNSLDQFESAISSSRESGSAISQPELKLEAGDSANQPDGISDSTTRSQSDSSHETNQRPETDLQQIAIELERLYSTVEGFRQRRQSRLSRIKRFAERFAAQLNQFVEGATDRVSQFFENVSTAITEQLTEAIDRLSPKIGRQARSAESVPAVTPPDNPSPFQPTLEQQQQHYEQLWHHYNVGLSTSLSPFERDVLIAQKAIQERGAKEATKVLCRSPEAQSLVRSNDRHRLANYIERSLGKAQENLLSENQREVGKWIASVLNRFLDRQQTRRFEGSRYTVHDDFMAGELILEAKDGRGVILKQQHGHLVRIELTRQDLEIFRNLNQELSRPATPTLNQQQDRDQMQLGD